LLAERWPRCFMLAEDRRLPLKVGIFHDLKAALGGKVSPDQLSRTLGTYCSAPDYQRRLKDGAARIDLDGQRAGTVTPSEAMWARAGRAERRDEYQRKRAPAVKPSSLADLRAAGTRRKASRTARSRRSLVKMGASEEACFPRAGLGSGWEAPNEGPAELTHRRPGGAAFYGRSKGRFNVPASRR
jgi:ProP effector